MTSAARRLADAYADERARTLALTATLREARGYVNDALEAHEHSDGRELLGRIDALLPQAGAPS